MLASSKACIDGSCFGSKKRSNALLTRRNANLKEKRKVEMVTKDSMVKMVVEDNVMVKDGVGGGRGQRDGRGQHDGSRTT